MKAARALLLAALGSFAAHAGAAELRYDIDYPVIGYSAPPTANEIARLQTRLDRGDLKLQYAAPRGYLDSLLAALHIDASSQVLVYSKTSLQFRHIKASSPRAIYFNDDTYIAWVRDSDLLEIATMDAERGAVFYTLSNRRDAPVKMQRETSQCLSCHDTFSMSGGGVPRFLFLSAPVDAEGYLPPRRISKETTDRTPIGERWGGWYVTGDLGGQPHLGNTVSGSAGNLLSLGAAFDTKPYLTDRSDVVALLVLEHQLYIKNLITRLNFKTRTFLAREGKQSWEEAAPRTRRAMQLMMDGLVEAMLFTRAAPLQTQIRGGAGFEQAFTRLGPRDRKGRSLRDFDLRTRLFKYPLSYVIYSEGFDALPAPSREYVYRRLATVLCAKDPGSAFAHLTDADRTAILQILTATKPEFARIAATRGT